MSKLILWNKDKLTGNLLTKLWFEQIQSPSGPGRNKRHGVNIGQ